MSRWLSALALSLALHLVLLGLAAVLIGTAVSPFAPASQPSLVSSLSTSRR